jgi:hypothetical protein
MGKIIQGPWIGTRSGISESTQRPDSNDEWEKLGFEIFGQGSTLLAWSGEGWGFALYFTGKNKYKPWNTLYFFQGCRSPSIGYEGIQRARSKFTMATHHVLGFRAAFPNPGKRALSKREKELCVLA